MSLQTNPLILYLFCSHQFSDTSIAVLYPKEDNYELNENSTRSPKTLAELATEEVCRSLPFLDGELPRRLPQDVVDCILRSLMKHSAISAATLRTLGNCELSVLSLANSRGVSDSWLAPLANAAGHVCSEMSLENEHREFVDHVNGPKGMTFQSQQCDKKSVLVASSFAPESLSNPVCMGQSCGPETSIGENDSMFDRFPGKSILIDGNAGGLMHNVKPCPNISLDSLSSRATSNLTHLDLRGSLRLTDDGLMHLTDLNSLEVARLDNCHSIKGRGLLAFASSHRLHTLSLSNCRRLTDEAVINISHLISISALSLNGCRCLTDQGLAALSCLYNLCILDISQCDLVTDEGIEMLESLEDLEEISLGWCRQLSDRALKTLAKQAQCSSNLRILRLARCNITDEGILELSHLGALQELDISGCSRISSSTLGNAVERLDKLSRLNVSYCPGIL